MVADNIKILRIFIQQLFYQKIHLLICMVRCIQCMAIAVRERLPSRILSNVWSSAPDNVRAVLQRFSAGDLIPESADEWHRALP